MNLARQWLFAILLMSASAGGFAASLAPPVGDPPPASGQLPQDAHRAAWGMRALLEQLALTADQHAQVRSIYAQAKPRIRALRDTNQATRDALAALAPTDPGYAALLASRKADAADSIQLQSDIWTQVYAVLTPAQQARIPAVLAAAREARATRVASRVARYAIAPPSGSP